MIGIPEDKNVDTILRWAHENGLYTIIFVMVLGLFFQQY